MTPLKQHYHNDTIFDRTLV